ncbi:MAG: Bug family tripartite tricarboxylate transporter substrate binding protein [Beijerinckiaceae bacterium]
MKKWFVAGIVPAIALCLAHGAVAQGSYPERAIKIIVPFAPGGLYDSVTRPLAEKMRPHIGSVVVENVGGAGSRRGAAQAAKADPDGYTLFMAGNASHVLPPLAASSLPYDPVKDFVPIALIGTAGTAIAVHPSHPAKNLSDVIAYAKKNPEKVDVGNSGVGSLTHLTAEMLRTRADIPKMVHVPYRGGGASINDLVAGHIPAAVMMLTSQVVTLHKSGKIRVVAITTDEKMNAAPDLAIAKETVPGLVSLNFAGLYAPKGTPPAIIDKVYGAVVKALQDPQLRRIYAAGGFDIPKDNSAAALTTFLSEELERWRPVVKSSGFKIN